MNIGTGLVRQMQMTSEIIEFAIQHNYIVVTCDLDFSTILSVTHDNKPSIIQIRLRNMLWSDLAGILVKSILQNANELNAGAILTIDARRSRLRLLPL